MNPGSRNAGEFQFRPDVPGGEAALEQEKDSMARIAGVDLPRNKQARIALTYIYGIGNPRAASILSSGECRSVQEGPGSRRRRGQPHPSGRLSRKATWKATLRKDVAMHIKRLIDIQSYRGNRHRRSLPVRGQRTHTNARTRKGPRKGTVTGKKKATKT